jgi:hypothetical protein
MGKRRLNNWKWWLQICLGVLLIFTAFAPLPETWHGILTPVAFGGLLIFLSVDSPASRRLILRVLVPLVALILLARLLSIDPRWVVFGFLGVYAGTWAWEVVRQEHAEYLAQRERLQ